MPTLGLDLGATFRRYLGADSPCDLGAVTSRKDRLVLDLNNNFVRAAD